MEFEIPGLTFALITKLYLASSHISFLTNFIINGTFDRPLFMITTVAALLTMIFFLHAWIQEFSSGVGGGGPVQSDKKSITQKMP